MFVNAIVALALFASAAFAQTNATSIDPNSVSAGLRASWCTGQENVCKTLCGSTDSNTCDPATLTYNCSCSSNHSSPDLKDYKNSMPYYICEQSYALCINGHPDDQAAQDNCTENIRGQCGTLDIANYTAAATTATASATFAPTPSGSGTTSATAASTSATKSSAADTAMAIGKNYGSSIIAAALVVAFGFMV